MKQRIVVAFVLISGLMLFLGSCKGGHTAGERGLIVGVVGQI